MGEDNDECIPPSLSYLPDSLLFFPLLPPSFSFNFPSLDPLCLFPFICQASISDPPPPLCHHTSSSLPFPFPPCPRPSITFIFTQPLALLPLPLSPPVSQLRCALSIIRLHRERPGVSAAWTRTEGRMRQTVKSKLKKKKDLMTTQRDRFTAISCQS